MKKLKWSPNAIKGFRQIYRYYFDKSPQAALSIYKQIRKKAQLLSKFPQLAKREPLLEKEPRKYRALIVRENFKIVYFTDDDTINIVAVWDCQQNPERLLKETRS